MERGERVFVLCFALKFPADMLWLLWLIVALSLVTAGQRFVKVWRQAEKPPAPLPVEPAAVVLRWRAWREERAGRETTSWVRSPRGPGRPAGGGFFSGSRRPGAGAAEGRWHERRLQRRLRLREEQAAGGRDDQDSVAADLRDEVTAQSRRDRPRG
jgi:CDP-diacylglycerol--glycerol-3-phosphate 3-phosphatidyltransferase